MNNYKLISAIFILFCFGNNYNFAQTTPLKTSDSIILGQENDTIFKAECPKTIIVLEKNTSDLTITLFRHSIYDDHPRVNYLLQNLNTDIIINFTIDSEMFEHTDNKPVEEIHKAVTTLSINGYTMNLEAYYRIEVTKTNSQIYPEKKLYFNLIFDPEDFQIESEFDLGAPFEIEIYQGLINEES